MAIMGSWQALVRHDVGDHFPNRNRLGCCVFVESFSRRIKNLSIVIRQMKINCLANQADRFTLKRGCDSYVAYWFSKSWFCLVSESKAFVKEKYECVTDFWPWA